MYHLLELFRLEHDHDILDIDHQMIQAWLVVAPSSKFHTVSTISFHKYGGTNFGVTNCMSRFSMVIPTKVNVKLDNGNTVHAQWIGIILCHFTNCTSIYPAGTFYYIPGYLSYTISLVALKCYVGFQKVTSEPLEHSGLIISRGMTGFRFYPTSDTEHYKRMILHNFVAN